MQAIERQTIRWGKVIAAALLIVTFGMSLSLGFSKYHSTPARIDMLQKRVGLSEKSISANTNNLALANVRQEEYHKDVEEVKSMLDKIYTVLLNERRGR